MAGEWETVSLSQLCEQIADCPHSTPLWTDSGVIVLRNQNIRDGRLDLSSLSYTDEAHFEQRSRRAKLKSGDLVLTREAPMGEVCMIPENLRCCLGQRMVMLRPDPKKCDSRFLLYSILSDTVQHEIKVNEGTGSTVSNLRIPLLEALPIPHPPLAEQKAIAAVLGALDDKIELNRRMNATLEAMARALFQSWFVDFDPVRAKLDGRQPVGLDPAVAALFSGSLQVSEAGHIPNDWTVGRVADIADFSRSSISPGSFPKETFDHYSLPAFDEGRTPKAELGRAIMSNKLVVTRDSVLLSKLNPHIPRIWLPDLHAARRSVCSTEFIVATPRLGYSREFLFSLFTCSAFSSAYCTLVTGTTGSHQRIRPESVLDMKIVIPPPPLVSAFTVLAKLMFNQLNCNINQSRTLSILRDTLLPKLLSGEMRAYEASSWQ
jgi:type I restriction enzyme S subunit